MSHLKVNKTFSGRQQIQDSKLSSVSGIDRPRPNLMEDADGVNTWKTGELPHLDVIVCPGILYWTAVTFVDKIPVYYFIV